MTIIEQIKAEIERRMKIYKESNYGISFRYQELEELLSFLSTLKSEKPMNPVCESKFKVGDVIQFKDGTNQYKICGVFSDHYINSIGVRMDMSYTDANFELVEHPVCEGLEEEINKFRAIFKNECDPRIIGEIANHFAQWQKEQMMKEAIEGWYDQYPAVICLPAPIPRMNKGDKVRIIIVKEDNHE